jgi:hypothetical protein
MKFSTSGKGEKKHSHKEGMGSEEKKIISERVRHRRKTSQGKTRIVLKKQTKPQSRSGK